MLCLLTLVGQIWFGLECSLALFSSHFSFFSMMGASIPLGVSLSTLIFFLLSPFLGHNGWHLRIHVICLFVLTIFLAKRRLKRGRSYRLRLLPSALNMILFAAAMIFSIPTHLTAGGDHQILSLPFQHEDIALFTSLQLGVNSGKHMFLTLKHPDRFGSFSVTRWFTAYHASMICCGGGSMKLTFFLTSQMYLFSLMVLIGGLGEEFELTCFVSPCCVLFPLFCSGNGFLEFMASERKDNGSVDFIADMGDRFPNPHRLNPVFQILLGSRPTMFAMAISTLCLMLLFQLTFIRDKSKVRSFGIICGFLIGGILPMVQHQSFVAMAVFSCAHLVIQKFRQKFVLQTCYLGFPLIISFLILNAPRYLDSDFLHTMFQFERQWQREIDSGCPFPILSHLWHVGGLFPFLAFAAFFLIGPVERDFIGASLISFFIFNYWKLQDQLEFNIFAFYPVFYAPGSVLVFYSMMLMYRKELNSEKKGVILGVWIVIILFSCLSGLASARLLLRWESTYSKNEKEMADWIIRNTPKDSVFYYNGGFANFMASLTGRQVYCVGKKVCEHEGLSCDGREDLENLSVLAGQVQYVILNEKESESFKVRASSAWKQLFPAGALRLFGRVE